MTTIVIAVPSIPINSNCNIRVNTSNGSAGPLLYVVLGSANASGTVTNIGGSPIAKVAIEISGPIATTAISNGKGKYSSPQLPGGTYNFVPRLAGYQFSPNSITVDVGGKSPAAVNFIGSAVVPKIKSITPNGGSAGDTITINGAGFGSPDNPSSSVSFGAQTAPIINAWSDSSIQVIVPSIKSAVSVTVTTAGGASNPIPFSYSIPHNLNIFPSIDKPSSLGLLALNFIPYTQSSTPSPKTITSTVGIENLSKTWYWVAPASPPAAVMGSNLPVRPFLLGPGQMRAFSDITFLKYGYLTFHADNALCSQVPGNGLVLLQPAQWSTCFADEQSRAMLWATEMEIFWRIVFGVPLPTDIANAFQDPILAGIAETVFKNDKWFKLYVDLVSAFNGDLYAVAAVPADLIDVVTMKELNDLLGLTGRSRLTRSSVSYLSLVVNVGIVGKYVAETLLYPNTGDLTFVAK